MAGAVFSFNEGQTPMPNTEDYRKPTNFSGGISAGGGDTGSDKITQLTYIGVKLTATTLSKTITLPAGTCIFGYAIMPGENLPGAGTVDAGYSGSLDAYIADGILTAPSKANLTTAVRLSAAQDVIFTATGLTGDVFVALEIANPNIRN